MKDWASSVQVNDAPMPTSNQSLNSTPRKLPEPTSLALVGLGLAAVGFVRGRRS